MNLIDQMIRFAKCLPGTSVERGLAISEIRRVEAQFQFKFPPDLSKFLRSGLPVGDQWPDWRRAIEECDGPASYDIESRLRWPIEGMLFDIENNAWWDPDWGEKPADLKVAKTIASRAVAHAPPLIPIYGHRYLPAEPCEKGNPVFSVYQMDIIIYGNNLPQYLSAESHSEFVGEWNSTAREIRCWTRWMNSPWWSQEQ